MLHMILGGAGCGKSASLINEAANAVKQGCSVRTLVPEPYAYTYDKRLYERLGAADFNRIRSGSFRSLTAEILTEIAAEPRDAADTVAKTVILHQLLQSCADGHVLRFYGRQADKPSFLGEMTAQLTELMQSGTSPEQLLQASADTADENGMLSDKLYDIARVYADYLDALDARGLHDTLCDPMTAAAAADGTGFLKGAHIFLDEYESFTGDQYAMLEIMLRDAAEVWIALRTDDMDAPDYTRFDAVNETARRLRRLAKAQNVPYECRLLTEQYRFAAPSLAYLSRNLFLPKAKAYTGESAVTVCEARDMTLEAEYCAAQIRQMLMHKECRAGDIMVVMHDIGEYGALLEAAFRRYEIPYFMDLRRSVLHTAVMKLPLCLLELARRTTTAQILIFLKTQLSPLHPDAAADLENFAYTWDIEGAQWEKPFPEEMDGAERAEQSRQEIMEHILSFRKAVRRAGGEAVNGDLICGALYACMQNMGVPERIGGLAAHLKNEGREQDGRALRRLWNRFTELLDALHAALENVPVTLQQMTDLLTAVLRSNQIPVPPQTLDAVTVQSAAEARYDSPKAIFVLGVTEGKFPANISAGGFFTEAERDVLRLHDVTLSRSVRDLCADEKLVVYKTLSAASERLWLCYPLADESGRALVPSALLDEVKELLPAANTVENAAEMGAAFYVSTKKAAYFSYTEDYTLTETERASVRAMLSADPEEAGRLALLQAETAPERLRIHDRGLMKKLVSGKLTMSASCIEDTMQCAFMGFCKHGLRLYERQKKNLNPRSVGTLVHDCMERLFREHPEKEDFLSMTPDDLRAHAVRCAEDFLQNNLGGRDSKPQRFLMQFDRTVSRMNALLLHTQEEMRQSEFLPDACELVIGRVHDKEGISPYTLTLPDGTVLYLNGIIDRVDITEQDGKQYLRIVDYKTNKKMFSLANICYGLNLQMLLYLFAVLDDGDCYPGAEAAGVLYMPAGSPELQKRGEAIDLTQHIQQYFRMTGTVLLDRGILTKMEKEIAGVYIPAKCVNPDEPDAAPQMDKDSQVFTKKQLQRLRKYVEDLLRECASCYAAGDVAPNPMRGGDSEFYADACRYCIYSGLCGITDDDPACRKPEKKKKETLTFMKDMLSREEEGVLEDELDA